MEPGTPEVNMFVHPIRRSTLLFLSLGAGLLALAGHRPLPPSVHQKGPSSDFVTLWTGDATAACFDFQSGGSGVRIIDGELNLDGVQMTWGLLSPDQFSFGFLRDSLVHVIDLGETFVPSLRDPRALSPKAALSIFHTLRIENRDVIYDVPPGKKVRYPAAREILRAIPRAGIVHVTPQPGHTYLFRQSSSRALDNRVVYAAFLVVDVQPGRSVTFRWKHL
jgi:hypothetical protein